MAQIKAGTVEVVNGSADVVGTDTTWIGPDPLNPLVKPGDIFTIISSNIWWYVATVTDDTNLTLTAVYTNPSDDELTYAITTSFTPNYDIPFPEQFDFETASLMKRALLQIDQLIHDLVEIERVVRSKTVTAPPGSTTIGYQWVVPAGATGAWSGQTNKIATALDTSGTSWSFATPSAGWRVFVVDQSYADYLYDGSAWIAGPLSLALQIAEQYNLETLTYMTVTLLAQNAARLSEDAAAASADITLELSALTETMTLQSFQNARQTADDAVATATDRDAVLGMMEEISAWLGVIVQAAASASADAALAADYAGRHLGTSTTSVAIATGSKSFTTQTDKFFTTGTNLLIVSDSDPTAKYMFGKVTSYSGTSLTVNVLVVAGSSTHTDWTIMVSGERGPQGDDGPPAPNPTRITTADSPYTATASETVLGDTITGTMTIKMPASPSGTDYVNWSDEGWNAAVNNITLDGNGNNMQYGNLTPSATFTVDVSGFAGRSTWDNGAGVWRISL